MDKLMYLWSGHVNYNIEIWSCEVVLLQSCHFTTSGTCYCLRYCFKWLNALGRGLRVHWKLQLRIIHNKWVFWDFFFVLQELSRKKWTVDHNSWRILSWSKNRPFQLHCWLCSKMLLPWNGNLMFQCTPWIFFLEFSSILVWLLNPKLWSKCLSVLLSWVGVLWNMLSCQ